MSRGVDESCPRLESCSSQYSKPHMERVSMELKSKPPCHRPLPQSALDTAQSATYPRADGNAGIDAQRQADRHSRVRSEQSRDRGHARSGSLVTCIVT